MTSPALDAALKRIDQEFGPAAFHRSRKRRARRLISGGPSDHENRLRYGWLADVAIGGGIDLDGALRVLGACHRTNKRLSRPVRLWGDSLRMLNADGIFQLRLMLRWLRRHEPCRLPEILDAMTTPPWSEFPRYGQFTPSHPVTIQAAE